MAIEVDLAPEVREIYYGYTPPFDVAVVVRDLLSCVPVKYFRGLKYIVLQNASGLSRRDRRRSIPSQGKRYLAGECLGFYRRQRPGHPAHIVLHADRIIEQAARLALHVSVYRDSLFAGVLYHELGHHIHGVIRPQRREPEDMANAWAERLRHALFQQKYHSLTPEDWQRIRDVVAKIERRQRRQPQTSRTSSVISQG